MRFTFRSLLNTTSQPAVINWRRVAAIAIGFSIVYIGHCDLSRCNARVVASCE